jgi:hypothetical protein
MRIAIAVFVLSAGIVAADRFARAEAPAGPIVRVRLYDYVNLAPDTVSEAQRTAAGYYSAIGVAIDWAPTERPRARRKNERGDGRLQDFTINILSRDMVARTTWPKNAIGTAILSNDGEGRIAYVLYDRLEEAAFAAGWPVKDLLGVVVAHELGHLLLSSATRSEGLMRPTWDVAELRRIRPSDLAFTPGERERIQERLAEVVAAR